jgi:hypothetical protein
MVARINTGKSIRKALNYNECKVKEGHAEILSAHNFLKDADQMNFYEKLATFEKLTSLNERATTNTLHISLNFDPSEKLEDEKLVSIAASYMKRIGFGDQPYLVYRHFDTGHPHIHIISTNIQRDGSRISIHNMGRNQSEVARKEIEIEFGLIKAESKKLSESLRLAPINAQKINPGKRATKAAISNILGIVIPQYKYGSLPELNAILKLYNVAADRCGEDSHTYKHNGLLFRVLDEKGNKIETPIKASLFYMKPTLNNLEKRFAENEKLKHPHVKRLQAAIDYALLKKSNAGLQQFINDLNKEKISVVLRQNKEGIIYGITYVDHQAKCVFNGSDLGKPYSAKMIIERTGTSVGSVPVSLAGEKKNIPQPEISLQDSSISQSQGNESNLLEVVTSPDKTFDYVPYQLKKKRKDKKKKRLKL